MSRQQRYRSRETTFDNPAMENYSMQEEGRYEPYAIRNHPPSRPQYQQQPRQTRASPPSGQNQRSSGSSLTPIPTVDAVVRPPSHPPSERSDYPVEPIKFEANKGFFLSYWRCFWVVLGVILLLVTVGLLIGFLRPRATSATPPNVTTVTVSPTLDPSIPWHRLHLPGNVETIRYDLDFRVDKDEAKFSGAVSITFNCVEETDLILVHALRLDINDNQVSLENRLTSDAVAVKSQFEFEEREYYVIELDETLIVNTEYVLRFGDFSGQLKEDLHGLYLSPYKTSTGEERTMVVSLFEPTFARKAFPCFDEPTFKAVYKVSVTHPRYNLDKVLFNTDLERSEDAETGWVREIFEETQKMSTYLLGFVIGDLTSMEIETQRGRKIRVWSRPDVIQQMTFALNYAEQCYIYFDNYFSGIEDPTPKTDIVAVPTFMAAGMEHWGLITCFEPYILYEESTSPIRKRNLVSELVAHEIAHSWFGNLVSLTSWADLWLKEGFATFFSIEAMQSIDPSSDAFDVSVVEVVQRALGIDSYPLSHPMTDPDVDDVSIILSNYDEITYYKGISVVRMLQTMLGDDSFRDGLMSYLRKYEYGNANADDLWAELTEISGSNPDIKEVMDTWILQQGYPVVTVTRETPTSRQLSVEQSLFLIKPEGTTFDLTTGEFGYKWYVHFMYNSRDAIPVKDEWMNKGNIELTIPTLSSEQWVQGNVELSSFLRVNYDPNNWELIIAQLTTDHMVYSEASRAAIVDDAFHLQRAGLLDTQIALRVTSYLTEEDSYLPWEAAYRGFQYLSARLYLTGSYGKFQRYVISLLSDKFSELGFTSTNSDSVKTRYLREKLVKMACEHGYATCTEGAMQYFTSWLNSNIQIPVDVRTTVYSVGVANSDASQWQVLWDLSNTVTSTDDKLSLREGLTKSTEPWVLNRYMMWCVNDSIISSGGERLITRVSESPIGSSLAVDFVIEHFDDILESTRGNVWALTRIWKTLRSVNRNSQLQQFMSMRNKLPQSAGVKKAFDIAVDHVKININWLEKYERDVARFLDENFPNA